MDTLKTAIVVVLLLAVLYGVYVKLNQPEDEVPEAIAWAQQQSTEPLTVAFGNPDDEAARGATASLADSAPWSSELESSGLPGHDHGMATGAEAISSQAAYDTSPSGEATSNGVPAPQLIASNNDGGSTGAGAPDPAGGDYYTFNPPAPDSTQTAETSNLPASFKGSSTPPDPNFQNDPGVQPSTDPNASVYAPTSAPTGGYGETTPLAGNQAVTATAEPRVADSVGSAAPEPNNAPRFDSRIASVLGTARSQLDQGQFYEALLTLSLAYNAPGISPEESEQLQGWLDPLAAKVIYSNEHLVGSAYQVQAGETLESVAAKHQVPWQLLANINGLSDPSAAQPGTKLKVVPGPFHAEVDITNNLLTLFVGRLYAGRFAIGVNVGNPPAPGEYQVSDKQPGHTYYAGNAQTLGPNDPQNPFGGVWIDLGGNVSIHGQSPTPGQSERSGCISLQNKDANDIYGILSVGSSVVIRR